MKLWSSLALAFAAPSLTVAEVPTYSTTVLIDQSTLLCTVTSPASETQRHRAITTASDVIEQTKLRQNRRPEELLANEPHGMQQFITVLGGSLDAVATRVAERCPHGARTDRRTVESATLPATRALQDGPSSTPSLAAGSEIRKIVDSGDPRNRIDVVFMGDGYTLNETERFFQDIDRLTNDMFTGDTFAQYLPLFNIWAVYVPSAESGIGVGSKPRDTAFQLYRDGTELRAVFTNKPEAAQGVCDAMGPGACDFPSLIGNDDYYGGLGGEFVISTRSPTSGTMVLRHEMGHNFGFVGEEYDGGQVYRGANSALSTQVISWKQWLTDPTRLVEEKAAQLYQKHIWYDLKQGQYAINFTSTGAYKRWYLQISVSGTDTDDSLSVTLDGQPLAWKSNGVKDRTFYQWTNSTHGFSAGPHQLVIKAGGPFDSPIIKQLCNAIIMEYGDESEFKMDDPNFIGMYPTFDIDKRKTIRPNNELCLMRNMTSTSFCTVCQGNLWTQFLSRIEFIDDVVVSGRKVSLKLIPLGQFRLPTDTFVQTNPELTAAEKYTVEWLRNDQELVQYRNIFEVDFANEPAGNYTVKVQFHTPSVRNDWFGWMISKNEFTLA